MATPATTSTTALPNTDRALATTTGPAPGLPGFNLYRPTALDSLGMPLPVIVWANGGCVRFDATWAPLLERWAAAGFVVIAVTTPLDGDAADVPSGPSTADDQATAIDWALEQNQAGPFAGRFDVDRVVAAGNSCGGITALRLAADDDRVRSVFILSGSSAGPIATRAQAAAVMSRIDVPVGFAVGGPEDIANAAAHLDYDVLTADVPGYVASRSEGDHPTVSTDVGILAEVAEIGVNWLSLSLYGSEDARQALSENPCGSCPLGRWTVTAKHLDDLIAP